jgi:hypothetical protein
VGLFGAVLAYFVAEFTNWQVAYMIGGALGLSLLALRYSVSESGMFNSVKQKNIGRGNFLQLFTDGKLLKKYVQCILIGLPIWYVIGILVTFSPEFAVNFQVKGVIAAGEAVMFCYIGLSCGDLASGMLSQYLKSRREVVLLFLSLTTLAIVLYLSLSGMSTSMFYFNCFLLGVSIGYWALFVTIAAEQFGTNLRATVATTVPNFIRGAVVPLTFSFELLRERTGMIPSAWIVGLVTVVIALAALWRMQESFGKDLNYVE